VAQEQRDNAGGMKGLMLGQDQGRISGSSVSETTLSVLKSGLKL